MSMNIAILASRKIQVMSTVTQEIQTKHVCVWQTPTDVSYKIQASEHPLQAYKDWVLSVSTDETVSMYSEDDLFCDGEPIGFKTINNGKEHIAELEDQIAQLQSSGYTISTEVW